MNRITKVFRFEAGHRLPDHKGKCKSYHGHSYKCEVTAKAQNLDHQGMVTDFSRISDIIGKFISETWDHAMLLRSDDPLVDTLQLCGSKVFTFTESPTVEVLCQYLWGSFAAESGFILDKVGIWETETCYAEYSQ